MRATVSRWKLRSMVSKWVAYTPEIEHRYQKWPYLKGVTFSKPSFSVSMLVFRGVYGGYNPLTFDPNFQRDIQAGEEAGRYMRQNRHV